MDLSDVQVISPSRGRFHKNYFNKDNLARSNYRTSKGRTFIDMDITDYPEFGTYYCPYENNESDNRRYFIKFATYSKDYPISNHNVKLSFELKNRNELLHKSSYFLIYVFFNENQEWLRFNIDLDSITKICMGENNFEQLKKNSNQKKEQTIYFYLKYPPKVGHKGINDNENSINENEYENSSEDDDEDEESKEKMKEDKNENKSNLDIDKLNSFNSSKIEDEFEIKSQTEENYDKKIEFKIINNEENSINTKNEKDYEETNKNLDLQNSVNSYEFIKTTHSPDEKEEEEKNYSSKKISNFDIEKNSSEKCLNEKNELDISKTTEEISSSISLKHKNQITQDKEFYFNTFKTFIEKYEHKNHDHYNEGPLTQKKNNNENENKLFISRKEIRNYDGNGFARLDSFLSKKNEYLNFYMLNLVMKI